MFLAQTFQFDLISIILILGFICAITVGAIRGFFPVLIDLGQSFISVIVSIFLAKPLGTLLFNTGYFDKAIERTEAYLINYNSFFSQIITNDNKKDVLIDALSKLDFPSRLSSAFANIGASILPNTNNMTLANYISEALFYGFCIAFMGVLFFILIFILVLIIRLFIKKLDKIQPIKKVNHFLGGVIGFVNGTIFVLVALAILTGLLMIPSLNESIGNVIALHDDSKITIVEFLYNLDIFSIILRLLGF